MTDILESTIKDALDTAIERRTPLSGGCIGEVFRVCLRDGRDIVAKVDRSANPRLDIEGYMLGYLARHSALPVPEVLLSTPKVLLMTFIEGDSHFDASCQQHAAALLAALHGVRGQAYGLERPTLIGSLHQPNPWTDSWVAFFREHRLLHMAEHARKEGVMGSALLKRIERFAGDLDQFIDEPQQPSLLHGDVWTTNVLASRGKITGFIDPAVYYGHPEIELAFTTLFSTFGPSFFDAYHALRPIPDGFFETRRDIYNLYPLLVHARLFGSSYLSGVEGTIGRLGY
jgi:fructosamine-3-kinase